MGTETAGKSQSPTWSRQVGDCVVSGCGRPKYKRGYCGAHYQRVRKSGDPQAEVPIRDKQARWGEGRCSIDDCDRPSRKRGWCVRHHERWRRHGDPLWQPRENVEGSCRIHSTGYVVVQFQGKTHAEHRLVWESHHGPLFPGQNIHHKNGEKLDNRIENLEIWDTTQPAGQRPEDKVEYALEMLRRYRPDLL